MDTDRRRMLSRSIVACMHTRRCYRLHVQSNPSDSTEIRNPFQQIPRRRHTSFQRTSHDLSTSLGMLACCNLLPSTRLGRSMCVHLSHPGDSNPFRCNRSCKYFSHTLTHQNQLRSGSASSPNRMFPCHPSIHTCLLNHSSHLPHMMSRGIPACICTHRSCSIRYQSSHDRKAVRLEVMHVAFDSWQQDHPP